MVKVLPGQEVEQHAGDIVVYELPPDAWDAGLKGTRERDEVFAVAQRGERPSLNYEKGVNGRASRVTVSGGSAWGVHEIVRVVATKDETRRLAFALTIRG